MDYAKKTTEYCCTCPEAKLKKKYIYSYINILKYLYRFNHNNIFIIMTVIRHIVASG